MDSPLTLHSEKVIKDESLRLMFLTTQGFSKDTGSHVQHQTLPYGGKHQIKHKVNGTFIFPQGFVGARIVYTLVTPKCTHSWEEWLVNTWQKWVLHKITHHHTTAVSISLLLSQSQMFLVRITLGLSKSHVYCPWPKIFHDNPNFPIHHLNKDPRPLQRMIIHWEHQCQYFNGNGNNMMI